MLPRIVFLCALAGSAFAQDPATLVREFAVASIGDDRALALRDWAPGKNRDAFARLFDYTRAMRCRRMIDVAVPQVAIDGDSAIAEVELEYFEWNASQLFRQQRRAFRATLARDGERWQIREWTPLEDVIAAEVHAAKSTEERRAIAARASSTVSARLPIALSRTVIDLLNQNRLDDAVALLEFTSELAQRSGDPASLSSVESVQSVLLRTRREDGWLNQSIVLAEHALQLAEESADPDAIAQTLLRFGRASATRAPFDRLYSFRDAVESPAIVALTATQLAKFCDATGEHRTAVMFATDARRYAELSGDPSALMSAEMNLGGSFMALGDFAMSRRHYDRAIAIGHRAGFDVLAAALTATIDSFDLGPGEIPTENAQASVTIDDRIPSVLACALHVGRAAACSRVGADAEAEEQVRQAMAMAHRDQPLAVWHRVADLRFTQRRYEESIGILEAIQHNTPLNPYMIRIAADALAKIGNPDAGIALLERERRQLDNGLATRPFSTEQWRSHLRDRSWIDSMLARLLVEAGRTPEALEVADSSKARLLRMLARERPSTTTASLERVRTEARLKRVNRELRAANPADAVAIARLQDELTSTRSELRRLDLIEPATAARLPRHEADRSAFQTPPGTVGLQFVVDHESTLLFTFQGAAPAIRCYEIRVPRKELTRRVASFVHAVEARDAGWRSQAKELYQLLLAPAEGDLANAQKLLIVPHESLWGVPFQALVGPSGTPLIERMAIEYHPMMMAAPPEREARTPATLLAFANPMSEDALALQRAFSPADAARALPDAEFEARKVEAFYEDDGRSRVYVGPDAQESRFKEEAPHARILHIATHAFADPSWPMYSALLFARPPANDGEDGILEAREIAAMRLRAEVAVLSACETGRGEYDAAEGVIGLPWAFLAAGTPAVVVSQWKVASRSTSQLMIEFHSRLRRRGVSPADALRGAQRALRAQPRYNHPFYWAPFVTITASNRAEYQALKAVNRP